MAHIVFISYGITSCLNACYRIAQQLTGRGHRVTFVSSLDVNRAITAQGFDFVLLQAEHALRQDPERLALERMPARQRYRQRDALIRVGERQRQHFLESDEIERVVQQLQPDLLLIDEELPEHIIALDKLKRPTFLLQYWPSTRKASNVPPFDSNIIPRNSVWSKLKIELTWQFLFLKRSLKAALAPLYYHHTDRRSIIKAIARRDGFAYENRTDQRQGFPLTFRDIPTLFLSAWEFDFPHLVPNKSHYVGPMVFLDREEPHVDPSFDATWHGIIRNRQNEASLTRPLVYGSIGTFWLANTEFVEQVIRAFAGRPDWTLIMSIGSTVSPEQFRPVPPNVHLFKTVPQLRVIKQADVVITHGGIGTVNECIFFGVPMLVYSGGKVDQNGNAARVEYHGLGVRGGPFTHIERQIEQLLVDPRYKTNVTKMQQVYRTYHRQEKAAHFIQESLTKQVKTRGHLSQSQIE